MADWLRYTFYFLVLYNLVFVKMVEGLFRLDLVLEVNGK